MEGAELHPGRGALFVGLRGRQHGRGRKTQQARDDEVRELRRRVVELQRLVVVGLACKGHLVFSGADFLAQLHHVLAGLELRIGLHYHVEPPQGLGQPALCPGKLLQGRAAARGGRCRIQPGHCLVTGLDDCFKCFPLVLEVSLGCFH